jgi:hypothetical protein
MSKRGSNAFNGQRRSVMKRLTGVLLVLAIFGAGYLTGACTRGDAPDSGRKMDALSAQSITPTSGSDKIEPKWYDDFERTVTEQREMDQRTGAYKENAHAVSLSWILSVVLRNLDKEEKNLVIVVTDVEGRVMPPEKYRIYIRGYKSEGGISWAEDFPPILYP